MQSDARPGVVSGAVNNVRTDRALLEERRDGALSILSGLSAGRTAEWSRRVRALGAFGKAFWAPAVVFGPCYCVRWEPAGGVTRV
ncbi:hypothetical protein NDU88_004705 [Pleurodeles waltl]|uniref:Uncharacterized protein n=1 Tax=Pleurodeles waltl TaxID=8319 RepID=A0AAV7VGZ7_PLEWA|nr:hypothetical protein NDU88_004705 [Pleurodeles waltl]